MGSKKTIIIAEDEEINQKILFNILKEDYEIELASNGKQTMSILQNKKGLISGVVLDLKMPVMDGYQVLEEMGKDDDLKNIPVVVATGNDDKENEAHALECGAWDFVSKPYDPKIIKFRLRNAIERSRLNLFKALQYQTEHDSLTDIYNSQMFYKRTREIIDENRDKKFVLARFDIDRFKQFNSYYGREAGDICLKYIAKALKTTAKEESISTYARIDSDVFAVCFVYSSEEKVIKRVERFQEEIAKYTTIFSIVAPVGIFFVDDLSIPVSEMLDKATLAERTAKGKYFNNIAVYDRKLGEIELKEQDIANRMNKALDNEEFCVYIQPKFNITTNTPIGGESLVRWNDPEKGIISPGLFIPAFEKNGFIAKVDYFVWKKTCQYLRTWIDKGYNPMPISVNVSRINLNNPNIVNIITELVDSFKLDHKLLELEITESAYMDNPEVMLNIVNEFHAKGFVILMDDFGSGYSSLNTLKDIPMDILKIDMKFLPTGENNTKSEKILASVIRMADWLGMPTIVEGVETELQKNFLYSVCCQYVQGFLYGKPMPVSDYEKLVVKGKGLTTKEIEETKEYKELDSLLSSDSKTDFLLKGIGVPMAIYEFDAESNTIDRVRSNQAFFTYFGHKTFNGILGMDIPLSEKEKLLSTIEVAVSTKGSGETDVMINSNGTPRWYRVYIRFLFPGKRKSIICAVYTEISREKIAVKEMSKVLGVIKENDSYRGSMLIVDDSEVSQALLSSIFEDEFKVIIAADGDSALKDLEANKDDISVILLDMLMPKMSGKDFLAKKNQLKGAENIPVVVISSDKSESLQLSMLQSGVNDYITKPFIPEMVKRRVHNVLEYKSRFSEMVSEFRKAASVSAGLDTSNGLLRMNTTEIKMLISYLKPVFDIVRIVDPQTTSVLLLGEGNSIKTAPYKCFGVWNRTQRCINCTSLNASSEGCKLTKYDFIENNIFYVISRPVKLVVDSNKTIEVVLEIVSRVSDSILKKDNYGKTVEESAKEIRDKIYKDPLTNAYNRRYLFEDLFMNKITKEKSKTMSLIMFDMNGFKNINDTYGHQAGDSVLKGAVKCLTAHISDDEAIIRYGGDEFLITMFGLSEDQTKKKIYEFEDALSKFDYGIDIEATAKFGYSYRNDFFPSEKIVDEMIGEADKMMYMNAKKR